MGINGTPYGRHRGAQLAHMPGLCCCSLPPCVLPRYTDPGDQLRLGPTWCKTLIPYIANTHAIFKAHKSIRATLVCLQDRALGGCGPCLRLRASDLGTLGIRKGAGPRLTHLDSPCHLSLPTVLQQRYFPGVHSSAGRECNWIQ